MRIYVQDSARKRFFDGDQWREESAKAKTFESVTEAEAFCLEHHLDSALIVVKSKDGGTDISYPAARGSALLTSKPHTTSITSLY